MTDPLPSGRSARGITRRSSSRLVAFVAVAAALIALAPFTTPATDRPIEVAASAASPMAAVAETPPDAHDEGPADDHVAEPAPSADAVSVDAQLDVVTDPRLLSAAATIQRQLVGHGWTVAVDGTIGAQTRRAIAEFQHANGLSPTGIVDTETGFLLADPDANGLQHYRADPLPVTVPPASVLPAPGAVRQAVDPIARIEQIADSVGFDWRSRGVTFITDCHPSPRRCASGSYYPATREIFITRSILTDEAVLRSVVLHELAHAWQFTVRGWPGAADDVSAWGRTGIDGLEAAADCLAAAWGASRTYQWSCPADAQAHLLALYEGS